MNEPGFVYSSYGIPLTVAWEGFQSILNSRRICLMNSFSGLSTDGSGKSCPEVSLAGAALGFTIGGGGSAGGVAATAAVETA
nr:hypothetical protein [Mycobacterium colombiense]